MSKPPKTDFMALIAGEMATTARPQEQPVEQVVASPSEPDPVVALKPRERVAPPPKKPAGDTLKARAHQLSVYLEPPVYDALRDLAHEERTKLHPLILEAIDLLLKKRGAPSIRELTRKAS